MHVIKEQRSQRVDVSHEGSWVVVTMEAHVRCELRLGTKGLNDQEGRSIHCSTSIEWE